MNIEDVLSVCGERDAARAELTRAQELLASARAQGEAHLQARLEAERKAEDWESNRTAWMKDYWTLDKRAEAAEHKADGLAKAAEFLRLRAEAAEARVKELEEMAETKAIKLAKEDIERLSKPVGVMEVLRLHNHFAEQSKQGLNTTDWHQHYIDACDRAEAAESKAAELQKRLEQHSRCFHVNAELQKRVDELEAARWRYAVSGIDMANRLEHAESCANAASFELGRALNAMRQYRVDFALLASFDAPGGGR